MKWPDQPPRPTLFLLGFLLLWGVFVSGMLLNRKLQKPCEIQKLLYLGPNEWTFTTDPPVIWKGLEGRGLAFMVLPTDEQTRWAHLFARSGPPGAATTTTTVPTPMTPPTTEAPPTQGKERGR